MLKSAHIEKPNNFLSENVSPSNEVNSSDKIKTSEIINPIIAIIMIKIPFTIKENAKTFRILISKKILTKLNTEKSNKFVYEESW